MYEVENYLEAYQRTFFGNKSNITWQLVQIWAIETKRQKERKIYNE